MQGIKGMSFWREPLVLTMTLESKYLSYNTAQESGSPDSGQLNSPSWFHLGLLFYAIRYL